VTSQHHSLCRRFLLTDNVDKPASSASVYLGFDGHLHIFLCGLKKVYGEFSYLGNSVSVMYCGKSLPSFRFALTNPCMKSGEACEDQGVGLYISTHFIFNCIFNFAINLLTKLQAPVVKPNTLNLGIYI
jgi:hypothetical protein